MNTANLPLWFLQWLDYYGCHVDYLKEHPLVENGYLHFKNNFQPASSERKFSSLFIFCTKFFVPWVCSWFYDYNLQNGHPVLVHKLSRRTARTKNIITDWSQRSDTNRLDLLVQIQNLLQSHVLSLCQQTQISISKRRNIPSTNRFIPLKHCCPKSNLMEGHIPTRRLDPRRCSTTRTTTTTSTQCPN